jgi:hypothetical protein
LQLTAGQSVAYEELLVRSEKYASFLKLPEEAAGWNMQSA